MCCSEPGPVWLPDDIPPTIAEPRTADGPNCGWRSMESVSDQRLRRALRAAEDAKWRTRQGHDIYLADEHWVEIHECRSWPDSTPGMAPFHVWVCRRCGEQIRQQIASSFSFGMGPSGMMTYGIQDGFSGIGGMQSEANQVLMQKMVHLQSHGVDVESIMRQRRVMQQEIETRMCSVTCAMLR